MALDFDGTDDQVSHGDIASINSAAALTTAFWILLDIAAASEALVCKGAEFLAYAVGDGTGVAGGQNGTWEYKTGNGCLVAGTWVHIACVFDGSLAAADRLKIYKNGASQGLSGSTPGTALSDQTGTPLTIANTSVVLGANNSKIAAVKLWAAALSAAEVYNEMQIYRPHRTANLKLWSPYLDGTDAKDYSGSGYHGTVTGAVQAAGPPIPWGAAVLVG